MKRISIANPVFNGKEKEYLNECIDTGWVSANGRFIKEFEGKFAEFCGTKYAISCSNGTVSLHLILMSLGIGPGDEVIMPTLTYIATANSVRYCGATPIFVDSEEGTFNMDPSKIEEKITVHTKAIMPVHLYGLPCDMDSILRVAERHGIPVIEDAAEAHGALYHGKKVGGFGLAASFSFFGNKVITCGEGGMVTTNDDELYKKMMLLKSQGVSSSRRYWHIIIGYNYRMTNMQAAVGLGQLENVEWHIAQRKRVAALYEKHLGDCKLVRLQKVPKGFESVYWMNNIVLSDEVSKSRDEVMSKMEAANIEMRPVFYPMHIMPPHKEDVSYPVAEKLGARGISLPSHALLTEEDVTYVCNSLKSIIQED